VKKTSILQNEQFELKIGSLRIFGLNQSYGGLAGGDFLNQIWLPDGSCLLAIGDVMGKLWGAWFVSMAYLAYFRTLVRAISMEDNKPFSLLKLMEKLNTLICRDLQLAEVFTTLCLLHINSDGSRYQLVNAGFLPRLGNLESIKRIQLQGTLLGLTYQATYEILEGTFKEGEFMVIPTDGWAESRPVQSDVLIGEEPLDRFLLETHRNGGPTIEFPELFNRHFQVDQMTDDASFLWISCSSAL
jgi:serine phosphatase RsbU (regulator of sigma subunit)